MNQLKMLIYQILRGYEFKYKRIFDNSIMNTIVKSFGARFGTGISSRQGIVQDLNRNVMLGTFNILEGIDTFTSWIKNSWLFKFDIILNGFVCPTESPDGGNVGIINHSIYYSKSNHQY